MFEDIMQKNNINIHQLSTMTGVGYNYIYKIVRNQSDFDKCGIETAKKIADALHLSLDEVYEYKNQYFKKKIYYKDQTGWDCHMYGELNAELNKLFLVGIDYHFSPKHMSRDKVACKAVDTEISCIKYEKLSEATKCIMVAILNQQNLLQEFVSVYTNLSSLQHQQPLKTRLYLAKNPYNLFQSYKAMNLEY